MTGRRPALLIVSLTAVALLAACAGGSATEVAGAEPSASPSVDPDVPPRWTGEGTADASVSFADGPALEAATGVNFVNDLGDVWDWELVEKAEMMDGESATVSLELANVGNDCRVLDERGPYEADSTDDGAASMALVEDRLAGAEIVAGPGQDLMGLGEGLGEDGADYNVARALGREGDGPWVLVTARAFVALGEQQVITVSCPTGEGIDLTRSQLAGKAYANLQGLDRLP